MNLRDTILNEGNVVIEAKNPQNETVYVYVSTQDVILSMIGGIGVYLVSKPKARLTRTTIRAGAILDGKTFVSADHLRFCKEHDQRHAKIAAWAIKTILKDKKVPEGYSLSIAA